MNAWGREENLSRIGALRARQRFGMLPAFASVSLLCLCLLLTPIASAQRTALKPGWNIFTPQQDIDLGKRAAADDAIGNAIGGETPDQRNAISLRISLRERQGH